MKDLLKSMRYGAICVAVMAGFAGFITLCVTFIVWMSKLSLLPQWALMLIMIFVGMTTLHYILTRKWFLVWVGKLNERMKE